LFFPILDRLPKDCLILVELEHGLKKAGTETLLRL
jgi:hypothetical protein